MQNHRETSQQLPSGGSLSYSGNVEVQELRSALTTTEYVMRGGRSHVFLLLAGAGELILQKGVNELHAPVLIWMPQGRTSIFRFAAGTRGMVLSIPDLHLGASIPDGSLGTEVRKILGSPIIRRNLDQTHEKKFILLIEGIFDELFKNEPAAQNIVKYSLAVLLIELWRASTPNIAKARPLPRTVFQTFVSLVDLHLTDHWTVRDYARHIGVSNDRLTSAVRRATGRSPQAEIHRKLAREAEHLLLSSGYQAAEIAFKLGFKDAAYFNRFFKRMTGLSPGRFRAKPQPRTSDSFASWP